MHRIALIGAVALVLAGCGREKRPPPAPAAPRPAPAAAAPAAAPAPAPPGGAAFARRAPTAGARFEERSSMVTHMAMGPAGADGGAGAQTMDLREEETRLEEVLATSGEAVTRLKVTYVARVEAMTEGGKERARPSPLVGKTFIVEAKDGRVAVLTEAGRPAPPPLARDVGAAYAFVGKPDPVLARMPTRPLVPGAPVPELADAIREEIAAKAKDMTIAGVAVTFTGVRGEEGVFAVTLELAKDEPPTRLAINLAGELRVTTATSAVAALTLRGPLRVTAAPGSSAKITGSGTLSLTLARRKL